MQPNELSKESIGTACWTTQVVAFDTIININMLSNNHRTAKSTDAPGQTDFVWCEKNFTSSDAWAGFISYHMYKNISVYIRL